MHADHGNDPHQLNTIAQVTSFRGGGIWLESSGGGVQCPLDSQATRAGRVLQFEDGVLRFNAQTPHCVMPWTRGPRVVLVAFSVQRFAGLRKEDTAAIGDWVLVFLRWSPALRPFLCPPLQFL